MHDTLQQHLRALDASESDSLSKFVTSLIKIKLDAADTMFEWQKHTQDKHEVPHFTDLLEFIDI